MAISRRLLFAAAVCLLLAGPSLRVTAAATAEISSPDAVVRQCAVDLQSSDWNRENAALQQLSVLLQSHTGSAVDYAPVIAPLMSHIGWGGLTREQAYQSADLLEKIGLPAVPALIQGLTSPEARLRWSCPEILASIRPVEPSVVPAIIPLIHDPNRYVRRVAIETLGQLGPHARTAVPALIQVLQEYDQAAPTTQPNAGVEDENCINRISCHVSLIHILGIIRPHVGEIAAILKDPDPHNRAFAAAALGDLGATAKLASPALLHSLHDQNADVRILAADALGKVGDANPRVVAALIYVLQTDSEKQARLYAAISLGTLGPKAKAAIPALLAVIPQKEDGDGWWVAVEALGKIGGKQVVPDLARALDNPNDLIRRSAAVRLGDLGHAARSALPALRKRLTDRQPYIRQAAAEAIRKIQNAGL